MCFEAVGTLRTSFIRMTQDERSEIDRAAEAQGESASEWARVLLLKSARKATR
jgi:uncharacterized protein (DUF1778 family)